MRRVATAHHDEAYPKFAAVELSSRDVLWDKCCPWTVGCSHLISKALRSSSITASGMTETSPIALALITASAVDSNTSSQHQWVVCGNFRIRQRCGPKPRFAAEAIRDSVHGCKSQVTPIPGSLLLLVIDLLLDLRFFLLPIIANDTFQGTD